jgi:hypothetical protein
MNVLGRLFVACLALLLAIPAGAGVLVLALVLDPVAGAWLTAGALAGIDGALADGLGCGLLTAALPWLGRGAARLGSAPLAEARLTAVLFLAGAAAGLVYWLVAGRHAGPGELRRG